MIPLPPSPLHTKIYIVSTAYLGIALITNLLALVFPLFPLTPTLDLQFPLILHPFIFLIPSSFSLQYNMK